MLWSAIYYFQIFPYNRSLIGMNTIPRNEGLAMDASKSQYVSCTTSIPCLLTCYLEVREPLLPRVYFL
jgi:hypothetical protein